MQFFLTVFVSAFLIFQIQPIVSKTILPLFGGGAGVWTTCLFFFQLFLLVGYFYAYLLAKLIKIKWQALVHLVLCIFSLAVLPFDLTSLNLLDARPELKILSLLVVGVGLPFAVLSASSPLLQSWFTFTKNTANPYLLYAISNLGSFLALILYPSFIEPFISLRLQTVLWSIGFCIFVFLIIYIGFTLINKEIKNQIIKECPEAAVNTGFSVKVLWLLFSGLGVIFLVSTTSAMSQNIPPVPFLWLVPLAIYLLTYVLAFSSNKFYKRNVWLIVYGFAAFIGLFVYFIGGQFDIATQILIYLFILFTASMVCHGELSQLKPNTKDATLFYLLISLGGVFGSFLVSFIAPQIFDEFLEFPIAILSIFILVGASVLMKIETRKTVSAQTSSKGISQTSLVAGCCGFLALIWLIVFFSMNTMYQQFDLDKTRNFYGILSVKDIKQGQVNERRLVDGSTAHGAQSLDPSNNSLPLSYYRPNTGVERVLSHLSQQTPINVGIIGLGVGALAGYGREQDEYTFYELNPAVIDFADKYFSFLSQSKANVQIKVGDARISLQQEADAHTLNQFDALVVDAFSGDVIPTHLLTREAFQLYNQHIAVDGSIILHISNRHLSLLPVILSHAKHLSMDVLFFSTSGGLTEHDTEWVVLTNKASILEDSTMQYAKLNPDLFDTDLVDWTDDYSSLLPILKIFE
ncbi:fused MFS/spermidine synthase [Paraglaciecola aquimarina]|uniref:Fused MFS/spermidine synthase n=1 Tax=Paraglaciecola algarum TaxID=3050085 RepID=A0ABS9D3B3_9ALTE|nr:fused MFS/spermidine synthase [Paraglaciecola sp. G1-23]MCF2946890.1 fused MFS/spermidine synthase [Paraglaciecola sp. G1-23]